MLKDPTAFRKRFLAWKETGELLYEAGLPKYNDGEEPKSMFDVINRAVRYIGQHEGFVDHVYGDRFASQEIALWNDPMGYRLKEMRLLGKQFAKEKTTHVEPVDFYKQRRLLQPVEVAFDIDVPESISLKNTFDTPAQKAIKAIDNLIALSRLIKSMSMEDLNPLSSITQKDIINNLVFANLVIPQIMGQ